jgi:hypothetical protein
MATITIYNTEGRILRNSAVPATMMQGQAQPGEHVYIGRLDRETQYVVDGEPVDRPLQPTTVSKLTIQADGEDEAVLENVPEGELVATHLETGQVVLGPINGTDSYSTTFPGTHRLLIMAWPYQDFTIDIEAV